MPKIFMMILAAAFLFVSCKNNSAERFPEIIDPVYNMYDFSGVRGYNVKFRISDSETKPYAVVINGIKKNISAEDFNGSEYVVNVISQSMKLDQFKPEMVDQPNGIIFKNGEKYTLKPINFRILD